MDNFYNYWKIFLEKPREDVNEFCELLEDYKNIEDTIGGDNFLALTSSEENSNLARCNEKENTQDMIRDFFRPHRMRIFIYELFVAGFLTNKATTLSHGEELYVAFKEFRKCVESTEHQCINSQFSFQRKKYTRDEQLDIAEDLHAKFKEFCGFINPYEVVSILYSTNTGREFLPPSLITYMDNINNYSQDVSDIKQKKEDNHNRSGSSINPEKHAITKEACQKAWEKIQKEEILELNANKFSEIATSFLKPGQSLITTVSREFYRNIVTKDFKAGVGRK